MAEVKDAIFDHWTRRAPHVDGSASHARYPAAWQAVIAAAVPPGSRNRPLRPGGIFPFSDGLWLSGSVPPDASSHDMTDYVLLLDELPYHRGLSPEKARSLLAFHGFGAPSHREGALPVHPYAHQATGAPHFFVMTAPRPEG